MKTTKKTLIILLIFYLITISIFVFLFESSSSSKGIWKELSLLLALCLMTQIKITHLLKSKQFIIPISILTSIIFGELHVLFNFLIHSSLKDPAIVIGIFFVIIPALIIGIISGIIITLTSKALHNNIR